MTEQDAMTRLAAANPVPDPGSSGDSARAAFLVQSVLARPRPRRSRLPAVLVPAGLVTAAVAAVLAVHTVTSSPVPRPPATSTVSPRTILYAAADHAESDGRKGKFVHATGTMGRVVHRGPGRGYDVIRVDAVQSVQPAGGLPGEGWVTIGESGSSVRPLTAADATAYARDGSPAAGELPKQALHPDLAGDQDYEGTPAELPDDPAQTGPAMIDWLAGAGLPAPPDPQGWLFRTGTRLLDTFTDVTATADRAKLLRMLAGVTGVRILPEPADPLGRPARGLAYAERTPKFGLVEWQVFLGADSDRISFTQAVVREPGPANATLSPGAVQYSTAVTSVTWSDKP